jgi:hypothetical protein
MSPPQLSPNPPPTTTLCHECNTQTATKTLIFPELPVDQAVHVCDTHAKIALEGEKYIIDRGTLKIPNPEFALIAPNVWAMNSIHGPGHSRLPGVYQPNRCIVFRLRDLESGGAPPFLLILNPFRLTNDQKEPYGAMKRLQHRVGDIPIRYLVSPDALHHLTLDSYATLFGEDVTILYPAGRIDRLHPNYAGRKNFKSYKTGTPEILQLEKCGFHIHLWRGAAEKKGDQSGPKRGTIEGGLFYFAPSRVLIQGSHIAFIDAPAATSSWLIRFFLGLKVPKTYSVRWIMNLIHDPETFRQGPDKIKSWDWVAATDLHLGPNAWGKREELGPAFEGEFADLYNTQAKPTKMKIGKLELPDTTV